MHSPIIWIYREIQPEFTEILPGIIPSIIKEIQNATGIPVITGGLTEQKGIWLSNPGLML
ncbi:MULTISPECIES: glycerol-3-phosphate responsive antiterminator [Planococcus]|uniref:glycerol-3-phosphate responsive antiterminator n=1 Tax=Planococcus TaxID=1372 RepID=UPI0022772AFA|nr:MULTISPECIES: glycerol-3-phosphate responsive antiterminator [Planococcus]